MIIVRTAYCAYILCVTADDYAYRVLCVQRIDYCAYRVLCVHPMRNRRWLLCVQRIVRTSYALPQIIVRTECCAYSVLIVVHTLQSIVRTSYVLPYIDYCAYRVLSVQSIDYRAYITDYCAYGWLRVSAQEYWLGIVRTLQSIVCTLVKYCAYILCVTAN